MSPRSRSAAKGPERNETVSTAAGQGDAEAVPRDLNGSAAVRDKDAALRQIGERLRELRLARDWTLSDVARSAGISPSFLGMLERGLTAVSVSRLIALADVYAVNVADLLANVGEPKTEFVPADQAFLAPTENDDVTVMYLSSASWTMQPFLVRLAPGGRLESLSHAAEEFVHCVSGAPTMVVGRGKRYPMSPGDTLFLPSGVRHAYLNDTHATATLVGAIRRIAPRTWSDSLVEHRS